MARPLVLITGGAGFVGINLCRFLLAGGFAVRTLDTASFNYPECTSVDVMQGDVRDAIRVDHAMRGVKCVVHAAAAAPWSPVEETFSANVAGTWMVLQTAMRHHIQRFVFMSSATVYGAQPNHLVHEADALRGAGSYAESKIEAERLCERARLEGLCISTLRLARVVGPERPDVFATLYDRACAGKGLPTLGSGERPCQILDIEDVCEVIYLCLVMRPELVNDTFNLAARFGVTMRQALQTVLDRAGHHRSVFAIPEAPVTMLLKMLDRAAGPRRYSWVRETAGQDNLVSVRHIGRRLGFQPRYPTATALVRDYDRYVRFRDRLVSTAGQRSSIGVTGCPDNVRRKNSPNKGAIESTVSLRATSGVKGSN